MNAVPWRESPFTASVLFSARPPARPTASTSSAANFEVFLPAECFWAKPGIPQPIGARRIRYGRTPWRSGPRFFPQLRGNGSNDGKRSCLPGFISVPDFLPALFSLHSLGLSTSSLTISGVTPPAALVIGGHSSIPFLARARAFSACPRARTRLAA